MPCRDVAAWQSSSSWGTSVDEQITKMALFLHEEDPYRIALRIGRWKFRAKTNLNDHLVSVSDGRWLEREVP